MIHVRYHLAFADGTKRPEVLGNVQYRTREEAEQDAARYRSKDDGLASADVIRVVKMREVRRRS